MSHRNVLLVEDHPHAAQLIRARVEALGHSIEHVADGPSAISVLADERFDTILLDHKLPGMSGLDVARTLLVQEQDVPIVMLTAHGSESVAAEAMKAGIFDYLIKDTDGRFLQELETTLQRALKQREESLERRRREAKVSSFHARVSDELHLASAMQMELLPAHDLVQSVASDRGFRIGHRVRTSSELGGDLWGIAPLGPDRFVLYLLDFCGHGVHAALNTFRVHTLLEDDLPQVNNPAEFLTILNRRLYRMLPANQFATMFCGVFDRARQTITFAAAASPPILIQNRTDAELQALPGHGELLGVYEDVAYKNQTVAFEPGGMVLLHSDGLLARADDDEVSETELTALVTECYGNDGSNEFLERLMQRLPSGQGARPADDVTVVSVESLPA